MSNSVGSKDLRSSLIQRIWRHSLLFPNFTITLFLYFTRWHAWIYFPLTWTLSLSKTLEILASNKLLVIEIRIRSTSKNSYLKYCTLAQHCCSVSIILLTSFSFTFLTIATLTPTFFICVTRSLVSDVSSFLSEFISDSNYKINLIKSGLFKPFNVVSVWTIAKGTSQKIQK